MMLHKCHKYMIHYVQVHSKVHAFEIIEIAFDTLQLSKHKHILDFHASIRM